MRCRVRISYLTVASFFVLRAERSQKNGRAPEACQDFAVEELNLWFQADAHSGGPGPGVFGMAMLGGSSH